MDVFNLAIVSFMLNKIQIPRSLSTLRIMCPINCVIVSGELLGFAINRKYFQNKVMVDM